MYILKTANGYIKDIRGTKRIKLVITQDINEAETFPLEQNVELYLNRYQLHNIVTVVKK